MKAFAKRTALLVVLVAFAIAWVSVMSLDFSRKGGSVGADGSQAKLTWIDSASRFPEIDLHVLVLDGADEPIKNLSSAAFEVTEDDIPVDIIAFAGAGEQTVTAILVLDRSGSMERENKMAGAREAALTFVEMMRVDKDQVGLITFDERVETSQQLTSDKAALEVAIQGVVPHGDTAYYDAVYEAINQLTTATGRRVVIALTDGKDNSSRRSRETTIQYAVDNHIPLYTIGLGRREIDKRGLREMAERTGGEFHQAPSASELAALYGRMGLELRNEYVLGYTSPTAKLDGTRRDVMVTVEHPGATVSTVGDYTVGGILAPTINWPLFAFLLLGLLLLLLMPGLVGGLVRRRQPVLVPEAAQTRQCPHCGRMLRAEAKFCSGCGRTLTPAPASPTTCPRCGHSLRPGAKFCSGCGQPCNGERPS